MITTQISNTNQNYHFIQALMQTVEDEMATSLGLLNRHIDAMFGNVNSLYIATTPRALLFEGIPFCRNTKGLAEIMCQILRDRQLNTMQVMTDGSVQFALFKYVRIFTQVYTKCLFVQIIFQFTCQKNETHDGLYSVHSGIDDAVQVADVKAWQNHSTLSTWLSKPDTCNRIEGTDASMFPPHRKPTGSLSIFSTDICR